MCGFNDVRFISASAVGSSSTAHNVWLQQCKGTQETRILDRGMQIGLAVLDLGVHRIETLQTWGTHRWGTKRGACAVWPFGQQGQTRLRLSCAVMRELAFVGGMWYCFALDFSHFLWGGVVPAMANWRSSLTGRHRRNISESRISAVRCYGCPTRRCGSGHNTHIALLCRFSSH